MKNTIDISAVYLRREGDKLQVLVETDDEWRLAIDRPWPADGCGLISHIAEANGKLTWPKINLLKDQETFPKPGSCVPCLSCGGMRIENCKNYPAHQHDWCDCQ